MVQAEAGGLGRRTLGAAAKAIMMCVLIAASPTGSDFDLGRLEVAGLIHTTVPLFLMFLSVDEATHRAWSLGKALLLGLGLFAVTFLAMRWLP